MPTQWCLNSQVEVNVRGSIQVSMHKMLRWEKKGPYDTMKFLFKKYWEQDSRLLQSSFLQHLHVELYIYTYTCTIKTNYMYHT